MRHAAFETEVRSTSADAAGVTFVVPVRNGILSIRETLESILAQADGRPMEIIVVDDGSTDGSTGLLEELCQSMPFRLIHGEGRGAAAAVNAGVRVSRYPIICQVDQDVVLQPGWMRVLTKELDDPAVGAAQGYFITDPEAPTIVRVMGLDLEDRYAGIGKETDHVCTGNAAYRAEALRRVGLFDETLGYGYDNDISYRLRAAGYRLRLCASAPSVHRWRDSLPGYLVQQYGFGYGRIDLIAKHPHRVRGDRVSPPEMISHPVLMSVAMLAFLAGIVADVFGGSPSMPIALALAIVTVLAAERTVAGILAAVRFRDSAALLFPVVHLIRDLAWVVAIVVWTSRRLGRRAGQPWHSMRPRPVRRASALSVSRPESASPAAAGEKKPRLETA